MKKFSLFLFLLFAINSLPMLSQTRPERAHRIKRSQFPAPALEFVTDSLAGIKRLRFYRETDSAGSSFEARFKKARLNYAMEFDKIGTLKEIKFLIKEVDIPADSFAGIKSFLENNFQRYRIRKMLQLYPVRQDETREKSIRNAFQNLLLPSIRYELMVRGKKDDSNKDYEILFGPEGDFISMKTSVPANYDHVLY